MMNRKPTSHSYFSQRLRLHYLDWGNEDAPNMLLVHGSHDHCHTWDWFAEQFADDYHIVAPDLRGHGDSEWVRGSSYHPVDYVYDLAQLVRQRELAPAVVVGHSMGGTLAALYAGLYPADVDRLVLLEGVGLWPGMFEATSAADRIRGWVDNTRALAGRHAKRYPTLEDAYARMRSANAHLSEEQARHLTIHGSNQNEDGTFSWKYDNYTHAFPAYRIPSDDTIAIWREIDSPTLIINAREGFPHRTGQNGTLEHFRHGRLEDIADAGHWVHHDQLEEVVLATRRFLAQT
ncbi:MAG: alpha/beta hydrolase [Pseudomonadales bacterium]|jgi:pimeloyl-ACP methyl ester carboxylesterase